MAGLDFLGDLFSAGVNWFNGDRNRAQQEAMANQNIAQQRAFAESGIQMKVNDAKLAGIHPLAALGAQTSSFSPVSVGSTDYGSMGQDIGRAIKAAMSTEDRIATEGAQLDLERKRLDNDLVRQQISASKAATQGPRGGQVGPPIPTGRSVFARGVIPMPSPGPARSAGGVALGDDAMKQKEDDAPAQKINRSWGYPLYANPFFGDGQTTEDRYGDAELGNSVKWVTNQIADHVYSIPRWMGGTWTSGYSRYKARKPWSQRR